MLARDLPAEPVGERLSIGLDSTPEQRRRFRELTAHQAARQRARATQILQQDPTEAAIWQRIVASYDEAAWMLKLGQFPNGRSMLQQLDVDLELWALAMNAIQENEARRGRADTAIWTAHTQQGRPESGSADER